MTMIESNGSCKAGAYRSLSHMTCKDLALDRRIIFAMGFFLTIRCMMVATEQQQLIIIPRSSARWSSAQLWSTPTLSFSLSFGQSWSMHLCAWSHTCTYIDGHCHVCVCPCIDIMHAHTRTYICTHTCTRTHTYTYICTCTCTHIHMHMHMHIIHIYTCTCTCVYVYVFV